MRDWLRAGTSDYLVLMTGDGAYRFADVRAILHLLEQQPSLGGVFGSRTQSRRQFITSVRAAYGENRLLYWLGKAAAFFLSTDLLSAHRRDLLRSAHRPARVPPQRHRRPAGTERPGAAGDRAPTDPRRASSWRNCRCSIAPSPASPIPTGGCGGAWPICSACYEHLRRHSRRRPWHQAGRGRSQNSHAAYRRATPSGPFCTRSLRRWWIISIWWCRPKARQPFPPCPPMSPPASSPPPSAWAMPSFAVMTSGRTMTPCWWSGATRFLFPPTP